MKIGYIETKDLGKNLDEELESDQIKKYKLTQLSQGVQNFCNGQCFKVTLENEDNLEEVIKSLEEAYKQQS